MQAANRTFLTRLALGAAIFLAAAVTGCTQPLLVREEPPVSPPQSILDIYFTDPTLPTASSYRGGIDEELAAAIRAARLSVDVAVYDMNLWSIRDALLAAHAAGVSVRVVTESDNLDEAEIQALREAGLPVLGDRREGLMHNKFTIIDRSEVWTGSMNYTVSEAYRNDNHLLHIRSVQMAENYTREFEEMFVDDLFGPDVRKATPNPVLTLNGMRVETFFSPDDGTATRLVELVRSARESIYFLAYSFTSDDLANAMLARSREGVTVLGVFEESQAATNAGTEYDRMKNAGLDVRLDGNPRNMHHKVIVIDGKIVVAGSYNFSASAERRNDENTLILHSTQAAGMFTKEFQRIYDAAQR